MGASRTGDGLTARIVGTADAPIWGMTSRERLRRALARAGVAAADGPARGAAILVLRADHVLDEVLVPALRDRPGALLVSPDGRAVAAHVPAGGDAEAVERALGEDRPPGDPAFAGLAPLGPAALAGAYDARLRKRGAPYALRLTAATRDAVERRMFHGSYKGVTDAVTKHVWPRPAFHATRMCAALGLSPNAVTWASLLLAAAAAWLFAEGAFLAGLACAWAMTFLDTVDGKLARVTLTSTRLGDVFDHGIDLVHPPFWYGAWAVGLAAAGMPLADPWTALAVVVGGYVAQRLQEGLFIARFGIEMHVWRPFDSRFRLVTARRNPNLVLLTVGTLLGRPDLGLLAVAAWTAASFLVHCVRIAQAFAAAGRGRVVSWLAAVEAAR
jgi:phosphatidylglycerophosphate synthase